MSETSQKTGIPKKEPVTRDIRGKLVFLGTGTSVGIPAIGCGCSVCQSTNPKNNRMRCSVVFGLPEGNLLIDTPPELRVQLLRQRIGIIHAVAFTHSHADHLFGLDDIRLFQFYLGHGVPIYCEANVEKKIRSAYDYAFLEDAPTHVGARPAMDVFPLELESFSLLGESVTPIRLLHGKLPVLGFRVGNVAYCTDVSEIPEASIEKLQGLDVLILDALRPDPHPTHFSRDQAIAVAQKIGAKRTWFTHVSCRMEHEETNAMLPESMQLAYDGLEIDLA